MDNNYNDNQFQDTEKQQAEARKNIVISEPRFFEAKPQSSSRGTNVKSVFAAFMAGALVVSGLMFTSDKMNLFTGGEHQTAASTAASASITNNGGATTASLDTSRPNNISTIAAQAGKAVVKIETKVKATQQQSRRGSSFFDQFFGQNDGSAKQDSGSGSLQPAGIGSGFIFDKSGYILTNEHVIDGADEIDVTVQGYDTPFKAKLLGSSYDLDLAVLKIENSEALPALTIGSSDQSSIGDWVVAIGNPYDFDYTVTAGLLSAKGREISIDDEQGTRNYKNLIQTDAAINPGNSGGPLLNMKGEVIGINTAVNSEAQGIGFAIPTSTISAVLDNLKNGVEIPKAASPYMGVSLQAVTDDVLNDLQLKNTDGALVADVQLGSPAYAAGIRTYDVITAINGQATATPDAVTKLVQAAKVGDSLKVTIVRGGKAQDVTVNVGDRNKAQQQQ
ncbi:S1C family serine protease [Paenibacillus whitsoniae]|uniref:PDZ domain-containing protein n=1 Tax=Paenibacillus whitsoniae TaxID=2496558 RepID=A0A430JL48_9BACL|nr:trypsin-like peptidase domain-containing protein [Paenibacillus whitsoniae]RTE11775.1 PDZ domain-containing protein [Paenibacillus whitsoniae]